MGSRSPVSIKTQLAHKMAAKVGNECANNQCAEEWRTGKVAEPIGRRDNPYWAYSCDKAAWKSGERPAPDRRGKLDFLAEDCARLDKGKFSVYYNGREISIRLSTYEKPVTIVWQGEFVIKCGRYTQKERDIYRTVRIVQDIERLAAIIPAQF